MSMPGQDDGGKGRLSDDDLARLGEQVAGLTSAGLPLAPGLRATAEEMPRGRLRSTLRSVADALDRGAPVDEALAAQGARLPDHFRGLVRVGARAGKVGQVLGQYVFFENVGTELRRRLWISMAYPAVALAVAFSAFVYICTHLVSSVEAIFRDFGLQVSVLTRSLFVLSHALAVDGTVAVGLGLATVTVWALAYLVLSTRDRRSLLGRLPVVGAVWRNIALAEFCHLLALLLDCEVPLGESLRLTGAGVRDASLERAAAAVAGDVEQGAPLAQALLRRPVFPRGLGPLLQWAEGHQSLPGSLRLVGEMLEARARAQAELTGTVFAVLTVVAVLVGFVTLVGGLFVPIITLITRLSG